MSNAKQILAMLRSRAEGDDDAFFSIALQVAASEARQGRRETAQEMRTEIDKARARNSRGASVAIPFASPRGSLEGLLEMRDPRYKFKDVVLNDRFWARFAISCANNANATGCASMARHRIGASCSLARPAPARRCRRKRWRASCICRCSSSALKA